MKDGHFSRFFNFVFGNSSFRRWIPVSQSTIQIARKSRVTRLIQQPHNCPKGFDLEPRNGLPNGSSPLYSIPSILPWPETGTWSPVTMAQMDYYGNDSSTDSGDDPVDLLDESGNPISDLYPDEESIGSRHDHEEPGTSTEVATSGVPVMSPRAYQYEMLEASLKQNVIVAVCPLLSSMVCPSFPQVCARVNLVGVDGHWKRQDSSVNNFSSDPL